MTPGKCVNSPCPGAFVFLDTLRHPSVVELPYQLGDVVRETREAMAHRFWSKVDKSRGPSECWPWRGVRNSCGYGSFSICCRMRTSSRVAWELTHGEIPAGMHCLHSCDNRACCNPGHLFLGTHADNMADRDRKGRGGDLRGERHWRAKLTNADVLAIRASTEKGTVLAKRYGVWPQAIYMVRLRQSWTHI